MSKKKSKTQTSIRRFLEQVSLRVRRERQVNQATKVAPSVIKAATDDINKIAEQRINQVISRGGQELERVLPKILQGAIEDVYQTPFRMLGNLGKKTFHNIKHKILK